MIIDISAKALGSHSPMLVFCYQCMHELLLFQTWGEDILSDLDVGVCIF